MQTESATEANEKQRRVRGRRDQTTKQEAVIKLDKVKDRVQELVHQYVAASDAAEQFASSIKATAEASGLLASVVRKFIVAKAGEKFEEKKNEAMQLSIVFEQVE